MSSKKENVSQFLKTVKEFALTVGEECPEGHRRDPASGRCLPNGPTDYTEFTRSLNDDQGDEWRGLVDKKDTTFASNKESALLDANEMEEFVSCSQGTTFSFIQKRCVAFEEAEAEDSGEGQMFENVAGNGHEDIIAKDPAGRKDTVNFQCPPNQLFDHKRRECIPLNKDTVLAAFSTLSDAEKAMYLSGKLGITTPDPIDGHYHLVTLDEQGNGKSSLSRFYTEDSMMYHSHDVQDYLVKDYKEGEYVSRHFGHVIPKEIYEYEHSSQHIVSLPSFGITSRKLFPLDTKENAEFAIRSYNQTKRNLSESEQTELLHNLTIAASVYGLGDSFSSLPTVTCNIDWVNEVTKKELDRLYGEIAKELTSDKRGNLPDSSFGVPSKRKFPLHDCSHVRNAMARFNQAKGLNPSEKATLRRKILSRAKACNIDVKNFAKAYTEEDFNKLTMEMLMTEDRVKKAYGEMDKKQGPCPPGMMWDSKAKKCMKAKGFVDHLLANHQEIIAKDPEGRRDTVNFQCPPNQFFDHKRRECIPLNKDTVMASQNGDSAARNLAPSPEGRPARLPQDCPKGTIWDGDLEKCKPLDSKKKTKSSESAQKAANGPGKDKDEKGCPPGQFFNPIAKKCTPVPGKFGKNKDKSTENAVNANPGNRSGLTNEVPGKVKHPSDCPAGTIWDGTRRTCTPLSTMDKNKPSGSPGPYDPKNLAHVVEQMSVAQLIQKLDDIIKVSGSMNKDVAVSAKDLPNEAFPPSLVRASKRSLLHHTSNVDDPYDNETVNVSRLRNALARVDTLAGYSAQAVTDAKNHLVYHARELVKNYLGKS